MNAWATAAEADLRMASMLGQGLGGIERTQKGGKWRRSEGWRGTQAGNEAENLAARKCGRLPGTMRFAMSGLSKRARLTADARETGRGEGA